MFQIGDYAVCPGHGVGQICDIEEKDIAGSKRSFYMLKIISNGMTVMVPTDSETGIRQLTSAGDIDSVYNLLTDHDIKIDTSTWNRRYREYMNKIKTGSLLEIADVLRALFLLKDKKSLSFGEKKMLDQCRELISLEISLSGGEEKKAIVAKIDSCFTTSENVQQ
ncbi:MAG TPA: CarD family transcriptional regulator [Bacteriovoracaceae bacterium]|nr:CarD family transcriptional regulator [Bacteriovoracaceae bacterium]